MSKIEHTCSDEDRHLDLICRGCLKKIIAKKDRLLRFVKSLLQIEVINGTSQNCFLCILDETKMVLKEIGELND